MSSSGLTVTGSGFERDGAPHRIVSGAMHYCRVHPDLWADRLQRLAAMGLNTVETYVAWNFHEPTAGSYDFSGWRDVARFIELAGQQHLDVIVRPGPYVCAEWDLGGLPAWLLADPARRLRCLDPGYLAAVDRWFDVLIPRLTPLLAGAGGPIVAVQVENEYGSYGDDGDYLAYLRDGLRRRGVTGLLVTSDGPAESMLAAGRVPGALATVNFGSRAAEAFTQLRRCQPDGPQMCMEFWNGWFDHWGEAHHVRDPDGATAELEAMLRAGASVNIYMAHGGSTFGLWNGANLADGHYQPTVTSYDYDAPIAESGALTEKFHRYRAAIATAGLPPGGPPPGGPPPGGPPPGGPPPGGPLPGDPPRLAPRTIPVGASAPLLGQLGRLADPVPAPVPLTMEQVGQSSGLIHYLARPRVPPGPGTLTVLQPRDRAQVFLDGRPAGVLHRNDRQARLPIHGTGRPVTLEILVENQGRVNYGPLLEERKGILGGVLIGDRHVFGWETTPLRLDDPSRFRFGAPLDDGPSVHRAHVRLDRAADGFLAFPGWDKGFAWVNGFLLGRYWAVGPQRTLYAPAPLWRPGENELIVLELHGRGPSIELAAGPDLGPAQHFDP